MIEKTTYLLVSVFGELIAILAVGVSDFGSLGSLVVFIGGILVSAGVFMATTKVTMKNVRSDLEDTKDTIEKHKKITDEQNGKIQYNTKQVELLRQLLETKHDAILDKLDGMRSEMKGYVELGNVKKEKYEENIQHIWKAIEKIEKKIDA